MDECKVSDRICPGVDRGFLGGLVFFIVIFSNKDLYLYLPRSGGAKNFFSPCHLPLARGLQFFMPGHGAYIFSEQFFSNKCLK